MMVHLTERELATMLAALRYWQQILTEGNNNRPISPYHFNEGITPLSIDEVDSLCEHLNLDSLG